jgi:hypothetical protein
MQIDNATSKQVAIRFENCWLARCLRPIRVICYQQSKEFKAPPFQATLICNGIEPVPITIKNPQVNERLHGTIKSQP